MISRIKEGLKAHPVAATFDVLALGGLVTVLALHYAYPPVVLAVMAVSMLYVELSGLALHQPLGAWLQLASIGWFFTPPLKGLHNPAMIGLLTATTLVQSAVATWGYKKDHIWLGWGLTVPIQILALLAAHLLGIH